MRSCRCKCVHLSGALFRHFPPSVDRRCDEIQMNTKLFIEQLTRTFEAHLMKFPKAVRTQSTDEFFGTEVQACEDIRSKAEFILMSACKPGRPPLTVTKAPQPSSTASIPSSAMKVPRPVKAPVYETPRGKGGVTFGATPSAKPLLVPETPSLIATVYVSKVRFPPSSLRSWQCDSPAHRLSQLISGCTVVVQIKSLEDELRALKEKYEGKA